MMYNNIQPTRLEVEGPTGANNLTIMPGGTFNSHGPLTFGDGAQLTINGMICVGSPLDLDTVSPATCDICVDPCITANSNIAADRLITNYLSSNTGYRIHFNCPMSLDTINEKMSTDGTIVDGALIGNGNFYVGENLVENQGNKFIGYAGLDTNAMVSLAMFPSTVTLVGVWDASANVPAVTSGVGTLGNMYVVGVAGTTSVDGMNVWAVNDCLIFDGNVWVKIAGYAIVPSVNNMTGAVNLTTNNVPEGGGYLYCNDMNINSLPVVSTDFTHTTLVSGNVHRLTADQVGNTVAQWNAGSLQGNPISAVSPVAGQFLAWNGSWTPTTLPTVPGLPTSVLDTGCSSFSVPGTGVNMAVLQWMFPDAGNYRIVWGSVCDYANIGSYNGTISLSIDNTIVSTVNLGGQHSEFSAVWYQSVGAGQYGRIIVNTTDALTLSGCSLL